MSVILDTYCHVVPGIEDYTATAMENAPSGYSKEQKPQ